MRLGRGGWKHLIRIKLLYSTLMMACLCVYACRHLFEVFRLAHSLCVEPCVYNPIVDIERRGFEIHYVNISYNSMCALIAIARIMVAVVRVGEACNKSSGENEKH